MSGESRVASETDEEKKQPIAVCAEEHPDGELFVVEVLDQREQVGLEVGDGVAKFVEVALDGNDELSDGISVIGRDGEEQGQGVFREVSTDDACVGEMSLDIAGCSSGGEAEFREAYANAFLKLDDR